ncbi:uncharacterized protein LOC127254904 [Andrographis paniculata]|uniref:uncharacterized protein LOC127254904 n=1 Tax=Andrographis paniculata TaxID=175694 RepID=UPI0021E92217|nr:uncharacterized protein LOC127254904 [Andrographis paniculata]
MGQIVKRRRKGRPPKVDLAAREHREPDSDLRRSLRRRNVKYVFDLDDYFDEDEFFADDDEERRRREKKLKHLLSAGEAAESTPRKAGRPRRVDHAPATSASSSDGGKPCKKRKIDEYVYEDMDCENEDGNGGENSIDEDDEEVREGKPEHRVEDSSPGTLLAESEVEAPAGLPLPDEKALELILDKLQKKDIYGVYAEPVDPEELPDYHDVIEHPMDFATVRNKLRNGLYVTFEQFESDVFLICSNAMQYNSSDTIYHKQARAIQELAKKKFEKIKMNTEQSDREVKPDQRMTSGSNLKKQIKRSVNRPLQEPLGSDFSSGATLASTDFQNVANAPQAVGCEKPSTTEGHAEGSSFLNGNNITDKVEEPGPGKVLLSRLSRKSNVLDENRRATYNTQLSEPVASRESQSSTFEGETKQLVPVGLYSDHSYARSLSRFSATLGSFVWSFASKRIEQALPQGYKFGRGWVGEYEPLPTPVVFLENCNITEPPFLAKQQPVSDYGNFSKSARNSDSSREFSGNGAFQEQSLPFLSSSGIRPSSTSVIPAQQIRGNTTEMKPPFFLASGAKPDASPSQSHQHQNFRGRESIDSEKKSIKQVELNGPPPSSNMNAAKRLGKPITKRMELDSSRPSEFPSTNKFSMSGSFKQPDGNGIVFGGLQEGKLIANRVDGNTAANSSSDLVKPTSYYPHEQGRVQGPGQGQGRSNPVQLKQMPGEIARSQQSAPHVIPSAPSSIGNNSNNASLAAARAWMSVGAGGLRPAAENANINKNQVYVDPPYHTSRDMASQVSLQSRGEFPPGIYVQTDKNSSQARAFGHQGPIPIMPSNQMPFQNQCMVYPQLATTADLSRFQLQSNWGNLTPQMVSRQKQESLPPDLNIGFQSSGSPGRQSSTVLVDSQQPDLALQL